MANKSGTEKVISGMALGYDTILAVAAIEVRRFIKDLQFIAAVPCYEQDRKWHHEDKEFYRCLIREVNELIYITSGTYEDNPRCLLLRNEWMVERSSGILTYYNGLSTGVHNCLTLELPSGRGDTLGCLRYAHTWAERQQISLTVRNFNGWEKAS